MSSKVDERIVNMKFNNSQFEKGVADTSKSLETLKKGMEMKDAGKGVSNLANMFKGFSLQGIADGVQSLASKFSALSIVGITALTNIANKAVNAGLQIAKSLTIDPVKAGFDEYELKMGSIQTILANTSRYGTKLEEVTANLDELNTYADKTIYNFGDMTRNIGLFTNAGIKVGDATSMIKGFSNEAAASGTNSQGAASAAYQLSQALSAGTIRLMDWRSLQNVGMGNKNMQRGLIDLAEAMGTFEKSGIPATTATQDFNGSLEKGWLSADVMSSYLKIMAGDMTEAEQAALGLSDAQIKAFKDQQKNAEEAATKVRTWTQLIGTLQEGVGSGWAQTFDILIGDFNQATELWTAVNDALVPIIGGMSDARNNLLSAWAEMGGRDSLIRALANAWDAAVKLLQPVIDAFKEIFPPTTAQQLISITKGFENFTRSLIPSERTIENIKRSAAGLFAVLDIGWMIIKQVAGLFGRLLGAMAPVGGGFLEMTGGIGDWLVGIRDAIKDGTILTDIFDWLGDAGENLIGVFKGIGTWIGDNASINSWGDAWTSVGNAVKAVWEWLQPIFAWIGQAFGEVGTAVKGFFETMDFNVFLGLLNAGLIGGLVLIFKNFFGKITKLFSEFTENLSGGGFIDKIKGAFEPLTDTLTAMQEKLKAEALMKIAIAIGLLVASVVALSFVDTDKVAISLGAMTVMFGQLAGMMILMDKAMTKMPAAKMATLAASMIALASAMVIMSAAVLIMSSMDWNELARGLVGMAGGMTIMLASLQAMQKMKGAMARASASLILFGTGLTILGAALKIFATMSWDDIGRSMTVLAGGLASLAVASKLIQGSVLGAAAMILVASAVTILSGAMKVFATMSWDDIGRSLVTLAGALVIMVGAMMLMSGSLVGAAAMIVVSTAITVLAGAFKIFATMSWDDIGRALVVLAGGLVILAAAMALMGIPIVLLGSVGIIAASAALMMLAPAMVLLGTMSWDAIGRGLTVLAGALVILAAGGVLLIAALPGLLGLGAAIALIGVGALAAGVGIGLFATGFAALAAAGASGAEGIKTALLTLASVIPEIMAQFAQGLIDFALVIANGGAEFTKAMTTLMMSLLEAINTTAPEIINTIWNLVLKMGAKLQDGVPRLVTMGMNLVIGILNGISKKVPAIARAGSNLLIALMDAFSDEVPRLADAGAKAIIKLVNGISDSIDRNSADMGRAGGRLAASIIRGMVNGIAAGIGEVVNAAKNMAANALNAAKNFLGINSPSKEFMKIGGFVSEGAAIGINKTADMVGTAGTNLGKAAMTATQKALRNMKDAVAIDPNMSPTIKPVLDLSAVKKDASLIGGLVTPPDLKLQKSVAYASQAQMAGYEAQESSDELELQRMALSQRGDVNFYQTNNSPKALTAAEVYRRTNNQLSVAKKELTTTDA